MVVASCSSGGGDATPDLPAPSSEPALPGGGDVVVPIAESELVLDFGPADDEPFSEVSPPPLTAVPFGDGPIAAFEDAAGTIFVGTTRPGSSFADDPQTVPWSGTRVIRRMGDHVVVAWSGDGSRDAVSAVAESIEVAADGTLGTSDGEVTVLGVLAVGWPGDRGTLIWTETGRLLAVPVTPSEQRVLWAMQASADISDEAVPMDDGSGLTASFPALRKEAGGWFGMPTPQTVGLVVPGEPGIALLAPMFVEQGIPRSRFEFGDVLGELELVAAGERAARQADRDEPRLEAATPAVAKRVDGRVLHELDERGMRRLIIAAVDVVGEDGLRRPGPALCLADMAINRTAGVRWGLTCTEERPGALTVSGVGSLALGRVRAEHYFDVWGVAGDGVHRVEVVLADGSRHEAITDPGSPFTVHVSNKLLVAVSEVNARDATDEIVERVTATEKGTLPGFLVVARGEHP